MNDSLALSVLKRVVDSRFKNGEKIKDILASYPKLDAETAAMLAEKYKEAAE